MYNFHFIIHILNINQNQIGVATKIHNEFVVDALWQKTNPKPAAMHDGIVQNDLLCQWHCLISHPGILRGVL